MNPNIWGPGAWLFLHSITLNFPKNPSHEQKRRYSDFFNLLMFVLPCNNCRVNYKKHLSDFPIRFNLNSRDDLVRWLITIHNETNKINGKKEISFDEFKKIYSNLYKNKEESITYYKNKNEIQKNIIYGLIITIIVCFIIIFFLRK